MKFAEYKDEALYRVTRDNMIDYAVVYGEFMYRAGSWDHESLQIQMLAYNLFNWFRRLTLAANMRKLQVDTIRLKLMKIAAKAVKSARYIVFKLCSSCPYKQEFYETLMNIQSLRPQLE